MCVPPRLFVEATPVTKKTDRKALAREYKKAVRPMGVFRVRNVRDAKSLIGVSRDLPAILNRQQAQLRMSSHMVRQLQEDWDALGPENFVFETLDTLKPPDKPGKDPSEDLSVLEAMWRERLAADGEEFYN